ncbi:hypothetical protein [Chitinophaga polysaccharea]|uniref:hypothetical protein n=1 Tax=Chitinophaga polysaccharea TaxID=1293035 RepID=UPI0011595718|nr:hypothetical protein [Chitinophaga polysaccharea]
MYRKLSIVSILFAAMLTSSCSKDKDDNPTSVTHKVQFKATATAGGNISTASYGVDGDAHTATNLSGTSWTSPELTAPAGAYNANIVVNGTGTSNTSTLKVGIYVDDVLKKEETASPGTVLSVLLTYKF